MKEMPNTSFETCPMLYRKIFFPERASQFLQFDAMYFPILLQKNAG
jgi:hypothetical protein